MVFEVGAQPSVVQIIGSVGVSAVFVVAGVGELQQPSDLLLLDRAPVFFAEVDDLAVVGGVLDVGVRNGVTAAPRQGQSEK